MKGILICNYLKILTNFSKSLSNLFGLSCWGNGTARGIRMVVEDEGWFSFDFSLLHSLTLISCSTRSSPYFSHSLFPSFSSTEGSFNHLPLWRVMTLICFLGFTSVLLSNFFLILIVNKIDNLTNLDLYVSIHPGQLIQQPL